MEARLDHPVTFFERTPSPLGELLLTASVRGITGLFLDAAHVQDGGPASPAWRRDPGRLRQARLQLAAYFARELREFDLPLDLHGTPFQRRVWAELQRIPYGETISYGELAERVGVRGGARAVGGANGKNPVAIVVPCHRVVASVGLGGYGGGLDRKRKLLDLESLRG
jgi:methylated-DNA-[protein]-cysteine S-methyltransferase